MKMNSGFDTETVDGNIVVIAWDDGKYIEYPTIDEIFSVFSESQYKRRFFCWNLRFDSDGILKMLPLRNIAELMDEKDTIYKNWKLHHLGSSNVVIQDIEKKHRALLWDIAQMYKYMRLANASKEYLSEKDWKKDSEVIKTFVDSQHGQNTTEYYDEHHDEINEYCIADARATKLLTDKFEEACVGEGYDFAQPYSLGNMAVKYFRPFLKNPDFKYGQIPRIHPTFWKQENVERRNIENIMDDLARGGWNDAMQRGWFQKTWDYDIISAYPTIMRDIPYWSGVWQKTDDIEKLQKAEYGFVFCEIRSLKLPLLPEVYFYFDESFYEGKSIKWVNNSVLHCVVNDEPVATTLTIDQWKYLSKFAEIKPYQGTILIPRHESFPLREPVDILIQRKFKAKEEKGKGSPEYWIAKTIMNSVSGKFKQKFHTDNTWFFYPHVYGKVTWKTKEIMADLITENDAWNDIIAVSTDGAGFTKELKKVDLSGELGSFEKTEYAEFCQIGNGIYYGWTIDGELKQRMRGFKIAQKNMDLPTLIMQHPKERVFKFPSFRPLHLRECFVHNKILKISDTNRFVEVVRHLDINKEIKRDWGDQKFIDVEDMLSGRILKSKPHEIRTARELSKKAKIKLEKDLKKEQRKLDEF